MTASVAGLVTRPSPPAMSTMESTMRPQYAESTPEPAATTKPRDITTRPPATTTLVPSARILPSGASAAGESPP